MSGVTRLQPLLLNVLLEASLPCVPTTPLIQEVAALPVALSCHLYKLRSHIILVRTKP